MSIEQAIECLNIISASGAEDAEKELADLNQEIPDLGEKIDDLEYDIKELQNVLENIKISIDEVI